MKTIVVPILFIFCLIQTTYSQTEDGIVALDIPVRNSLMFNRFEQNPTFSFVREQNKYITVTNKRELVQVEDAPETYLFNYAGRFRENIGAGIGLFQQNYGVFTNFGGLLNFAYNVRLEQDSNLTFGMNVGAYKSTLNTGKVVTNYKDPALENIPTNLLLTINPGLNYGTGFMDFGISLNNAVTYNFESSGLLEENPKQGFQGHVMYTGYFGGYGFFDESRFSALARSEFQKDNSIYSGVLMLTVPKGIWAQVGYNNVYGASGGIGINITPQIAVEYNYEKPFYGLSNLGSAHEITLAYRFKNDNYYDYSRDDEIAGIFTTEPKAKKKTKKAIAKVNKAPETEPVVKTEPLADDVKVTEEVVAEQPTKQEVEEQARIAAENLAKQAAEEQARIAAENLAKQEAEEQARIAAENLAKQAAEEQARIAAENLAKQAADEQARIAAENLAKQAAEEQARIAAENLAKLAAEEQARIAAENLAKQAAEEQARIAAENLAKQAAEEQARIAAEELAKQAAEEQARIAAEELAKREAEENSEENQIINPTDEIGSSISALTAETEANKKLQTELLAKLETAVAIKASDLKDLKEENDLSEQDIYVEPKPFKSISEENKAIELLFIQLDTTVIRLNKKVLQLESLIEERVKISNNPNDATNLYYNNALVELKKEQQAAKRARESLVSSLDRIAIATEFERKRRIKRAVYNNDEDRYIQDRARLNSLKQSVPSNGTPLSTKDLDFGKENNNNIQILKNVKNTENGYYLVHAVHSNIAKRDEFLTQVISSGNREVDFFFDVNTSEYYIYTKKFNSIQEANEGIRTKENKAYNEKMFIIKIEN